MADEYCSTPARALSLVTPPPGQAEDRVWADRDRRATGRVTDNQAGAAGRLPGPAGGDLAALRRLETRGLVAIAARVRAPRAADERAADRAGGADRRAGRALAARGRAGAEHLLHGVTGSGKTEVYLRAAAAALAARRGVIVLVPEIALTPQTVARFEARFGDTVALLHSALSEGERYDEWRRLRTRRGAHRGRPALGRVRAGRRPRAGRRRRGARRVLQARGRPALRRAAGRRLARLPDRREAARRVGHPAPGDLHASCRTCALPTRVDGGRAAAGAVLDMRGAQHPLHPDTRRALGERASRSCCSTAAAGRTSSPARLREGVGVPELRRRARPAPRRARDGLPPLRPPRARPDALRRLRLALGRPLRRRHRAPGGRARRALDVPIFRLDADTARPKDAVPELLGAVPRRTRRPAARHPDGRQGPRLPGRHPRRGRSTPTRRCASRTSAPRSARSR